MKPFNLEEALAGFQVVTRSGFAVSELVWLKTAHSHSRVVAVIDGTVSKYSEDGISICACYDRTLFMSSS